MKSQDEKVNERCECHWRRWDVDTFIMSFVSTFILFPWPKRAKVSLSCLRRIKLHTSDLVRDVAFQAKLVATTRGPLPSNRNLLSHTNITICYP
jgi:hypothetical protein